MIHFIVERQEMASAIAEAMSVYRTAVLAGRHVLRDAPGDFRTNLPERRLSAAHVLISARVTTESNTHNQPTASAA